MTADTRILIIGLGSIGQRHVRNLHQLGYSELYAVSSGKGVMPKADLPIKDCDKDLQYALDHYRPQVVFVCNPTSLHMDAAIAAAKTGAHLFLEKPIGLELDQLEVLKRISMEKEIRVATGFQFRHHPVLSSIKRQINNGELGKVISVTAHWGEYLPNWHPWEDYRLSYSAKADLGGGVTFTLCHPFDYLRWMLGEPRSVRATIQESGKLGIEVDDIHDSTWHFQEDVVVSVHLNYLEQPARHDLVINGQKGRIEWSNQDGKARIYKGNILQVELTPDEDFDRNDLFINEVKDFMTAIAEQKAPLCDLEDGIANVKMILASKASSVQNKLIFL